MEQPKGFEEGGDDYIWRLRKTLYETMQSTHDWAENLDRTFEGHGYYKLKADPQIHSRVYSDEFTLTSTWTNNILGTSSTIKGEILVKSQLGTSYKIKDLGEAKLILGMQIDRNPTTGDITLSQRAYCKCMIKHLNMENCSPKSTPLPPGLLLTTDNCPNTPDKITEMKDIPY